MDAQAQAQHMMLQEAPSGSRNTPSSPPANTKLAMLRHNARVDQRGFRHLVNRFRSKLLQKWRTLFFVFTGQQGEMEREKSANAPADTTTGLYASTCEWIEHRVGIASPHAWTTAVPAVVAISCLALLFYRRLRCTPPAQADKLDTKVVAARSALEEIKERERQRREQLEAEVQHIRGAI